MSKAARWFRSFLSGKSGKDKEELEEENPRYSEKQPQTQPKGEEEENKNAKQQLHRKQQADNSPAPSPPAKESRRRWSFRRSSSTHTFKTGRKEPASTSTVEAEDERARRAMAVAAATKAAADAAAAAAQAATVVIRLTEAAKCRFNTAEGAAAVKIQSVFRSYLARKALKALRGFVKLQALIRGQLVRRIVTAHAADRARRMAMAEEAQKIMMTLSRRGFNGGRSPSPLDPRCRRSRYDLGWNSPEMDLHGTKSKSRTRASPFYNHQSRQQQQISPSSSALTDLSLIASSGRFEESSFRSAESSSMHYFSPMSSAHDSITETMYVISNMCGSCPNYMANTQSSKAKARSQSTPGRRPPTPRRRSSMGSASDGY